MSRQRVIYTDEASTLLTDWLNSRGYEYTQSKLNSDCVEYDVQINNTYIKVWFDSTKQIYGFDRLHGGAKTGSFEVVTKQFEDYVEINSVLIPEAKVVADTYEKKLGIKSVFDTFVGRSDTGFTVKFRDVTNKIRGIRVKPSPDKEYYHACYVEYSDDKSYSVIDETRYTFVDKLKVEEVSDDFDLASLADENCTWNEKQGVLSYFNNDLRLNFKQEDDKVILISGNSGLLYTIGIELHSRTLDTLVDEAVQCDCWEYIPLYDEIKQRINKDTEELIIDGKAYKLRSVGTGLCIVEGNIMVEIPSIDAFEEFIQRHIAKAKSQEVEGIVDAVEELATKGVSATANTSDTVEPKETVSKKQGIKIKEEPSDIQLKLVTQEGALRYVRFILDANIYDIMPDKVVENGLDYNRIREKTDVFLKHGMEMTEDELNLKKFAVVVKDDEKIREIIASLFR